MPSTLPAAALALVALAATASATGNPLDPFPSLRSVGDTVYTKFSAVITNVTGNGTKAEAAAAASAASHAVTNALRAAKSPAGNYTYAAFQALDTLMYNKTQPGVCNPANKKEIEVIGIDGSGLLLPFYQGVIQGLQDRRVITPENLKSIKFGGLSGGALTSTLTALGYSGAEQFNIFQEISAEIEACKQSPSSQPYPDLVCNLNANGIPVLRRRLPADAAARLSGHAQIWACMVDVTSNTIANSVPMATSSWSDLEDLLSNLQVTDMIPCFTSNAFYNIFRGAAYVDGGYCADFAQTCSKSLDKCLKLSTSFLGPSLNGFPKPTAETCKYVNAPNLLPNPGKPYFTPSDPATWTLPRGPCSIPENPIQASVTKANFVAQGVSAKPDIHPAFYAPLPSVFTQGPCQWLSTASGKDIPTPEPVALQAIYDHGYASGIGWADANGYCA